MREVNRYPVRTPEQLPALLKAFRKQAGLTQGQLALRLGVTQQTFSALERNAHKVDDNVRGQSVRGDVSLEEGKLLDYITNEPVKDTPKEQARQRIARALFHEYGISVEDMVPDFKKKSVDIAIFEAGAAKAPENLRRVVICDKEPRVGSRGTRKMRDHKEAEKEFRLLYDAMAEPEATACRWGQAEDLGQTRDYPVFMAVAEKVGFDRRGNTLYRRGPDGEDLVEEVEIRERLRLHGLSVVRMRRKQKTVDDDLARIATAFCEFRKNNPEPGT